MQRIGILTGGGDCPGLNAVIRAVVKTSINVYSMESIGFRDGFCGLVFGRFLRLHYDDVSNILTRGGTILGMSRRDSYFRIANSKSRARGIDRTARARRVFRKEGLSCLIAIGGEGTLTVANHLNENGIPVIGVPKTIDNDVPGTERTFGFDSALAVATEAIDRLHTTAESHHRVMIVEVMGRHAGWLALNAGVAGGGDVILLPEFPFSWTEVCRVVRARARRGRRFSIIVAAEGARPKDGTLVYRNLEDGLKRRTLGGIGEVIAREIEKRTGLESREVVLGYLQRGGSPTAFDRTLATRFGHAAARLAAAGETGVITAWREGGVVTVPLREVAKAGSRPVPPDHPLLETAVGVGTSFGIPPGTSFGIAEVKARS